MFRKFENIRPVQCRTVLVIYMLLLLVLSLIPSDQSLPFKYHFHLNPEMQNLGHVPAYMILSFLWFHWFEKRKERQSTNGTVFLYASGYGIINEFVQIIIPGRFFSVLDMMLNIIGVFMGIRIYSYCKQKADKEI